MVLTLIINLLTIISLVIMIIIKPTIKIKNRQIQTFWIIPLIGVTLLLIFTKIDLKQLGQSMIADTSVNPIKILILFISMSFLSIVLDEAGFFQKCAVIATKKAGFSQYRLFFAISLVCSILTIFTSNDIVILTFTPFICLFAKRTKISPLPYLISEFVFANTWSMLLIIGNPTNIYLATSFNITFFEYFKVMFIPSCIVGVGAYFLLLLIFKKQLKVKMNVVDDYKNIKTNRFVEIVGLIHLIGCLIVLIISSYIQLEMWLICLGFTLLLSLIMLGYMIIKKDKILIKSYQRLPYSLIPFVLSMFTLVESLNQVGVINQLALFFDQLSINSASTIFAYGIGSFLMCNVLNNIPMSVMVQKIIEQSCGLYLKEAIFSSIVASNIGAYLTPIGALAGIMWLSILGRNQIKFGFKEFIKVGIIVSPILLILTLTILLFII